MIAAELARYRSSSHNIEDYLIFQYLWHIFHWWSLLLYGGVAAIFAFARRMLGITDDDY